MGNWTAVEKGFVPGKSPSEETHTEGGTIVLVIPLVALGDVIVDAIKQVLRDLFSFIPELISDYTDELVRLVVGTPSPNAIYTAPTNNAWPSIYAYYWDSIIPLSLFIYGLSIGLVIFLESTSYLFSTYHRSKLKKRAFSGLLGILAWWWIAALSLQFVDALTGFILPSLSELTLFETLTFASLSVLGVVLTLFIDLILFVLIALVYLIREILLYFFVLAMPILIALWVPGVGPFALVSGFVRRLSSFFVPFLFMTVPVALMFRLGEILVGEVTLSMGDFGLWLLALVIPLVALLSPFVLIWQAGAVFLVADRVGRRASAQTARNRVSGARNVRRQGVHQGENFIRGVQGRGPTTYKPPRSRPPGFRANDAGTRLNEVGSRFGSTLRDLRRDGGGGSGGGNGDGSGGASGTTLVQPTGGSGGGNTSATGVDQQTRLSDSSTDDSGGRTETTEPAAGRDSRGQGPTRQASTGDTADEKTHVPVPPAPKPPWEQDSESDPARRPDDSDVTK
jgi:hypothetical protein